jgi:putative hydrolase of the HAD superfamily
VVNPDRILSTVAVTAVLVDLDDTLIVEESHARSQLRATASLLDGVDDAEWERIVVDSARTLWRASPDNEVCRELGIASWEGLWASFDNSHPRLSGLSEWAPVYQREAWLLALARVGQDPALAPSLSRLYVQGQRAGHPLLPGAADLLRQAAAKGPVGLVTNGPSDIQRLKIRQTGLASLISAVVISGEVGAGKPDPLVFQLALDELDADPAKAVMVGDSWDRDVQGALEAGMTAVWISHRRPAPGAHDRVSIAVEPSDVRLS